MMGHDQMRYIETPISGHCWRQKDTLWRLHSISGRVLSRLRNVHTYSILSVLLNTISTAKAFGVICTEQESSVNKKDKSNKKILHQQQ